MPDTTSAAESIRPWGQYFILSQAPNYKVKEIEIKPGKRLSYQSHQKRAEHWLILEGVGEFTLNGEVRSVSAGDTCAIQIGDKHRIANTGESLLKFIEIQTGTYFGEDDITRFDDDYGRF